MTGKANAPNWKKIKAEYLRGGISQQKLADKYGITRGTLQYRMRVENWQGQREEVSAKTNQKLIKQISDKEAETLARFAAMQTEAVTVLYEKILSGIEMFPDGVGTKTVRETVEVKRVKLDDGTEKAFPLRSSFTSDIESAAHIIATLGKLYGLDAASILAKQKLEMEQKRDEAMGVTDERPVIIDARPGKKGAHAK